MKRWFKKAEEAEDALYGLGGDELPPELADRRSRLDRLKEYEDSRSQPRVGSFPRRPADPNPKVLNDYGGAADIPKFVQEGREARRSRRYSLHALGLKAKDHDAAVAAGRVRPDIGLSPSARQSRIVDTIMRVPFTQALPWQTVGSTVMRSW